MPRTEIWIDTHGATQDTKETIILAQELGHLAGVTTNPKIIAQGRNKMGLSPSTILNNLLNIVPQDLPIAVQVPKKSSAELIVKIAQNLNKINPRFIIKIHTTKDGLIAMNRLKNSGIRILATGILSGDQFAQALLAGAEYAAPYLDRMRKHGINYYNELHTMIELAKIQGSNIKIMAASIRDVQMIRECMLLGVHAMTIPPKTYNEFMLDNAFAVQYENIFAKEWQDAGCVDDGWFVSSESEEEEQETSREGSDKNIEVQHLQVGSQPVQKRSRITPTSPLGSGSPFSSFTSYSESPASSPIHTTTTTTTNISFRSPSPTPGGGSQE